MATTEYSVVDSSLRSTLTLTLKIVVSKKEAKVRKDRFCKNDRKIKINASGGNRTPLASLLDKEIS